MTEQELADELGQVALAAKRKHTNPDATWIFRWADLEDADKALYRAIGLAVARAVQRMDDHLDGCHRITGYYALENDCSCGLYERRMALNRLIEVQP